jgi:hypothetical protein
MTNATLTTKFEVGKTYHSENGVKTYTVLRRTEKTVWLETEDNTIIQKRVKVTNFGNEKITDNFLETTSDCETTSTNLQDNVETLKGWEYINSQAEYENRNNSNYIVFSNLSTAAYNDEFYGYFEKVYNWLDTLTSEQLDNIVGSFKDIDPNKHYINFYYRAMELYQKTPIGNPNKTTPEPTKVAVTEPKVKSLIVCDRKAISDVVYFELIEAFNLKDDECLIAWGGFYRYEKPKKSMTEPCVYFVFYEHVNGRSGGNYQVKVTFDEPCTI